MAGPCHEREVAVRVVLARTAGFCIGVKRALELVLKAINENQSKGRNNSFFSP